MDIKLKQAIEGLYETFAIERKPTKLDGDPRCMYQNKPEIILKKKLRDLSADDLERYAFSLFNTVGDEQDFKYFLPRMFELIVLDEEGMDSFGEPEIVIGKLRYVDWKKWYKKQFEAIEFFLDVVIEKYVFRNNLRELALENDGSDCDSWLCAVLIAGKELDSLLCRIEEVPDLLILLRQATVPDLSGKLQALSNGFWNDYSEKDKYFEWLTSGKVAKIAGEHYKKFYNY